jgi:hypothetical protein
VVTCDCSGALDPLGDGDSGGKLVDSRVNTVIAEALLASQLFKGGFPSSMSLVVMLDPLAMFTGWAVKMLLQSIYRLGRCASVLEFVRALTIFIDFEDNSFLLQNTMLSREDEHNIRLLCLLLHR